MRRTLVCSFTLALLAGLLVLGSESSARPARRSVRWIAPTASVSSPASPGLRQIDGRTLWDLGNRGGQWPTTK